MIVVVGNDKMKCNKCHVAMPKEDCKRVPVLVVDDASNSSSVTSVGVGNTVSCNSVLMSVAMILLFLLSSGGGVGMLVSARLHSSLTPGLSSNSGGTSSNGNGAVGSLFSKDSHGNCNRDLLFFFKHNISLFIIKQWHLIKIFSQQSSSTNFLSVIFGFTTVAYYSLLHYCCCLMKFLLK